MQTLRKKTSPCKYKNEPSRFLGDGVSFKAKLIGILEVGEARGDRMCQEALADLKMAIRAAGEHKQRITVNIAIDGLRLRDEKTGDSLYHHPVHKISFIAQDMSDSRAFGYIFGSPDTGHRFFGIKTDKAASQVVIAMRDLFQVVFELKKKEIELAKQHIEQKARFPQPALFSESAAPKSGHGESKSNQESSSVRVSSGAKEAQSKGYQNGESHRACVTDVSNKTQAGGEATRGGASAIADLVDLELELNSIQQGIHQMERITPSDPFGPNKDDPFNSDPFGDSFISFPQKPFLPPPPSSGRERQNRIASDTSSSLFSPKTPKTGDSIATSEANLFKVSQEDTASCDWFTPTGSDSLFEEAAAGVQEEPLPANESNTSLLSQIDVFTELDPLGTGRSKPYVDKKLFFQELKNPPKKVLKDLVSTQPADTTLFPATFDNSASAPSQVLFSADPFAESDPFDKTDPFSENDFVKSCDPFDADFIEDFKVFNKQEQSSVQNKIDLNDTLQNVKLFPTQQEKLQPLFSSSLSKSPNRSSVLEKQLSLQANHVSPRTLKQNTFDSKSRLHENPSLDMSSESECAPEPPPRPASNISPIKPPPLPPKKQAGELARPPPRPPHTDEPHYDYMDSYESGADAGPPLPVPARKSRFDQSDQLVAATVPLRPPHRKAASGGGSSDDDYLTPVPPPQKKDLMSRNYKRGDTILLPPPTRKDSRRLASQNPSSLVDSKPKLSSSPSEDKLNLTSDTLDITLSQLTLSGLNELATKLNIPPSQLSNMTLVQLTSYLSDYVKSNDAPTVPNTSDATVPTFQADFSANFNECAAEGSGPGTEPYDRYAVFRELLQQEQLDTRTDEPSGTEDEPTNCADRYAALREIIIDQDNDAEQKESNLEVIEEEQHKVEEDVQREQNDLNVESYQNEAEPKDKVNDVENNIIEYECSLEQDEKLNIETATKTAAVLEPTEIIQTGNHLTSGSLSDAVTGSSPEMDNCETVEKKNIENAAGESWAIFDTANLQQLEKVVKGVPSEEGVSPWSSDSKEFGNGSPPGEWPQQRRDSESEGDWAGRKPPPHSTWWESQPPQYARDRRSTDSYEEEWYDAQAEQRRARRGCRSRPAGWGRASAGGGGQSSSSRDVSPWEEDEPRAAGRRDSDTVTWQCSVRQAAARAPRPPAWERRPPPRDSWDEDDDYDYEEEYVGKYQYHERHVSRESDDWERLGEQERRHVRRSRCRPDWDREDVAVFAAKDKRYSACRYGGGTESSGGKWRGERERGRYYKREQSHESPWEDEYCNEPDEQPPPPPTHYPPGRRNWKRPSSASEMDRKTGDIKPRATYHPAAGGSDGERDRRYKSSRRSRSRDSQFSDAPHTRHKADPALTLRYPHRTRDKMYSQKFENNFTQEVLAKAKIDPKTEVGSNKKSAVANRKKGKDLPSPKTEMEQATNKTSRKQHLMFENDFVNSETDSPVSMKAKFNFDNEFETSEAESPTIGKYGKYARPHGTLERGARATRRDCSPTPRASLKQSSMFEDDFSPTDKSDGPGNDENGITVIPEELSAAEPRVSFTQNNLDKVPASDTRKHKHLLAKSRLATNIRADNLKKSESVNIFARESDPFDDDFFSGREGSHVQKVDSKSSSHFAAEYKWTEDFDSFDIPEETNK